MIVPAARRLTRQVESMGDKVEWSEAGEPDGFGRHRAVTFDAATSKWLAPVLEAVQDPRILSAVYKGKPKVLTVTFVPTVKADFAHPYPLEEAAEVLR